jgi:predicted Ser/Thr protein kinase
MSDQQDARELKMATIAQCPNPTCGRTSQLGDDPLGRVFRCPRCLSKLPTTAMANPDSGWTNVLGPLPRRASGVAAPRWPGACAGLSNRLQSPPKSDLPRCSETARVIDPLPIGGSIESGEFFVEGFEPDGESVWTDHEFSSEFACPGTSEHWMRSLENRQRGSHQHPASGLGVGPGERAARKGRVQLIDQRQALGIGRIGGTLARFQVLGVLGEGRHSTVYRAFDPILEREVALKLPRLGSSLTARALERFLGEARALARLRHPRIVPVYEAGHDGGRHYIAMGLIEGHSLSELIAEGPLAPRCAAQIVAEIAEALAYAHSLGIVHRDVKPANVRLDYRGEAFLMDFGIAYRPDSGEVPTPPGRILGTPAYVAPEQAQGGQSEILPASDQYSLGAVLYELLCGRPPFSGPPPYVLFHTIHHEPPSPREVAPAVPRGLAAICHKALAKQPERRYPSCQALADDLRRWLRGETPAACRRSWIRALW